MERKHSPTRTTSLVTRSTHDSDSASTGSEAPRARWRRTAGKQDACDHRCHSPRVGPTLFEKFMLICPKCDGETRIISFIDEPHVIKRIFKLRSLRKVPRPARRFV